MNNHSLSLLVYKYCFAGTSFLNNRNPVSLDELIWIIVIHIALSISFRKTWVNDDHATPGANASAGMILT